MKVVAVINQKGGVGKTTTAVNLAASLAQRGVSTLLIDLDPQANATAAIGMEPEEMGSLFPAMLGECPAADKVRPTSIEKLSIIPAEIDLAGCEVEIAKHENHLLRLRQVLAPLKADPRYEVILLDCPPSLGILMTNALAAADGLIVPIQCEFFALQGIQRILEIVPEMCDPSINPDLKILGVLLTMFDVRTRLSQQVMDDVREHLPELVFKTIIPRSIRLAEAPGHGKPISLYDPEGVGAKAYKQLAKEFLQRTLPTLPTLPTIPPQ